MLEAAGSARSPSSPDAMSLSFGQDQHPKLTQRAGRRARGGGWYCGGRKLEALRPRKSNGSSFLRRGWKGAFGESGKSLAGDLGVLGWWNGPYLGFKSQLCVDSALNIRSPFHRMTCDEKMNNRERRYGTPPGTRALRLTRSIGFLR